MELARGALECGGVTGAVLGQGVHTAGTGERSAASAGPGGMGASGVSEAGTGFAVAEEALGVTCLCAEGPVSEAQSGARSVGGPWGVGWGAVVVSVLLWVAGGPAGVRWGERCLKCSEGHRAHCGGSSLLYGAVGRGSRRALLPLF